MNINIFQTEDIVLLFTSLLLLFLSIASWAVIIRKIITLGLEKKSITDFNDNNKDYESIHKSLNQNYHGALQNIVNEVISTKNTITANPSSEDKDLISINLIQSLDKQKISLDSGMTLLASIASSAPFIGLFGTVWGIYNTLTDISAKSSAGLSVVAGPMGEALCATALGLFTAIPALLAYNAFVRANRIVVQDLRHICEKFTVYLSRNVNKTV